MDRLLDVIEVVQAHPGLGVGEIAEHCGVPFSTAYRLMRTLSARGWVVPAQRGRYLLGPRALSMGEALPFGDLLQAVARPELARLALRCKGHAHLGILENDMVTYLVKQSHGRGGLHSREGQQLEAYCSALGKILLARLDGEDLDRYLAGGGFVPLTRATITDPAALAEHLQGVREQGWAADMGEVAADLFCVAVAVPIIDSSLPAAISVSSRTLGPERVMGLLPALRESAAAIATKLSLPH